MNDGTARGARLEVRVAGGAAGFAQRVAATAAAWCWLDGASPAAGEAHTSLLGIAAETRVAEPGREREFLAGLSGGAGGADPAEIAGTASSLPGRGFSSGSVVALGYELGVALLGEPPARDTAAPGFALRLDAVLAIDATTGRSELRADTAADLAAWLAEHGHLLGDPGAEPSVSVRSSESAGGSAGVSAHWRRSDDEYAAEVAACQRAIRDGDAYVVCLTDTAETRTVLSPVELYLRLRSTGVALRGGVLVTPDRALVSASPERFLSLRAGRLSTHPIKGTRPRGATGEEDAALAAELAADPKERAENLMIVDLMRNDLARVCAPGSVAVTGFLRVETHPQVHQLVSTVSGDLAPGNGLAEVLAACFPGGSMTGAPKRRAVQLLAGLEAGPRGLYAGCFGWVDRGGDAELAMTIRSVELRAAGTGPWGVAAASALVGAGGGITADSCVAAEVAEKHLKAAAILTQLGARERGIG